MPRNFQRYPYYRPEIAAAFDRESLRTICQMHETEFADAFQMQRVSVPQRAPADFYLFKDHGAKVLAVAHLDTVADATERRTRFVNTEGGGTVVFSRALDDRLGAYIILDLLPRLGIQYDILLTVGEEQGQSTAGFFQTEKEYDWIIEFDRGGTDVVMYQYEDSEVRAMVKQTGARVDVGSFSDISYMEHLGVKAFNWGTGYRDYHGPRAHAFLEDTFMMVDHYLDFHDMFEGTAMPHFEAEEDVPWWRSSEWSREYDVVVEPDDDKDWDEYPTQEAIAEALAAMEA